MEYGLPGWRASSAPDAPLPPVATIAYRDHHPQKASMFDDVFTALALADGDQSFSGDVEENKFKDGQPRTTMHGGAAYDGHRNFTWHQIPFNNGHHVPSEQHSGTGHLAQQFLPQMPQQQFGQQQYNNRQAVNGVFPSPPFSSSGQVLSSPPPHSGSFDSRPMSAASLAGSLEHHSPNSGYSTPHGAYTTPPPSHTPHTPAKSPSSFQNGSSDLSSNGPSPLKEDGVVSPVHPLAAVVTSSPGITGQPPPLVPVPSEGYTLAPSIPNSAQVISVNQFPPHDQSDKKLTVPPISTLLTPVSVQNTPSTMHISANPISQPENISQDIHTTVLPPLETVMGDNHRKAGFMVHLPEHTDLQHHLINQLPHLSEHVRIEMNMPDIIQTHTCQKCRSIECSCDQIEINDMQRSRLQCQRCHKMFSYEKRLEQHLDTCKAKGGLPQEIQKSGGDPNLQCPGCGKQFKSIRWLEWHKENKCSVIDKNVKLEEFRQKVEKLQARAEFESRQERGEPVPQYMAHPGQQHLQEFSSVQVKSEPDMRCRKCSTLFSDEGLLRGHEEVCQGPISKSGAQGLTTMYSKDVLAALSACGATTNGEAFTNDVVTRTAQQIATPTKKKVSGGAGDSKPRFQCEHCEKSFTLMTNKNRHVRKAHGVPGNSNITGSSSNNTSNNNLPNNQYTTVKSGVNNVTNVNTQSDISQDILVPASPHKTDNTLLIAALNESLGQPEEAPTSMISELLSVINQSGSFPVDDSTNQQQSSTSADQLTANQIPTSVAHLANQISLSSSSPIPQTAGDSVLAQVPTSVCTVTNGNAAPVADYTYEDKKHRVVVTVTAAKQNEVMMASDPPPVSSSASTSANENASVAISESYIDSGLGTPSPTTTTAYKGRSSNGSRGRKRSHVASYDPTSCSSPSQSSDGSTNGDSQTFPTRLHQGRYVCGICEASFTFQTNLTRHQRKLHGKPYVRNPRKDKESPQHHGGESRSPTATPVEMNFELPAPTSFMTGAPHHMVPAETRVYHHHQQVQQQQQEVPIHQDVMLNQDSSLSNDNTEMAHIMDQPQAAAVKVETTSSNGSPTENYTDISYESHTIPYNAL